MNEFDELELDEKLLKKLKDKVRELEEENSRGKELSDDEMPKEIQKRIERLVDGN